MAVRPGGLARESRSGFKLELTDTKGSRMPKEPPEGGRLAQRRCAPPVFGCWLLPKDARARKSTQSDAETRRVVASGFRDWMEETSERRKKLARRTASHTHCYLRLRSIPLRRENTDPALPWRELRACALPPVPPPLAPDRARSSAGWPPPPPPPPCLDEPRS